MVSLTSHDTIDAEDNDFEIHRTQSEHNQTENQ